MIKQQERLLKIRMWLAVAGLVVTLLKLAHLIYQSTLER